jgi:hypothetical protein
VTIKKPVSDNLTGFLFVSRVINTAQGIGGTSTISVFSVGSELTVK